MLHLFYLFAQCLHGICLNTQINIFVEFDLNEFQKELTDHVWKNIMQGRENFYEKLLNPALSM